MVESAKKFFGTKDVRNLRKIDIMNYKKVIEDNKFGLKGKTVKNYLDLFKTFLNFCSKDLEVIGNVPVFPEVDMQSPKFKWLSQEDQIKLFESIPDEDKPIIAFLMLHGCRPGEARALRVRDVDLHVATITISSTWSGKKLRERRKGRKAKPVTIPIHQEKLDYISQRVKGNLPGAFIFTNSKNGNPYSVQKLRKIWDKVRKATVLRDLRLYDARRHSFASQLVNAGSPLYLVSKLMGHSSTKMTERYSHESLEVLKTNLQKTSLKRMVTVPNVALNRI